MRQSQVFSKTHRQVSQEETSLNAQILLKSGFIHKEMTGVYSYLFYGKRVLDNIQQVIREELNEVGCQEIEMTALQSAEVWKPTGRWSDEEVDNWFKTELANGTQLGLAFTHEEPLTNIMKAYITSYKDLPQLVYQFQTKFRNELRAKSGIMRGREFLMKDLYSFHRGYEDHLEFYNRMKEVYMKIFRRLGIGDSTFLTMSSGGSFSKYSFEFQTISEAGEDVIYYDPDQNVAINADDYSEEVLTDFGYDPQDLQLQTAKSIEVGDIYTLGTKYSQTLGLTYTDEQGADHPVFMGSYGIGVSRLLGTLVEFFAQDNTQMTWPEEVAPFTLHLICLNTDKSDIVMQADQMYQELCEASVEILYDDRDLRPGEKLADADLIGIPHRVIVSSRSLEQGGVEYNGEVVSVDYVLEQFR